MKCIKIIGLVAIMLSAHAATADTYQIYVNEYGGTSSERIDFYTYPLHGTCTSTAWNSTCDNRYVYEGEVYKYYSTAVAAAISHFEALEAAYEASLNTTPLLDKLTTFVEDYEEITWLTIDAQEVYVNELRTTRFNELKSNTEWLILNKETNYYDLFYGTYDEFLSEVAAEQTSELDRIHYQVNNGTGQARIKLVNSDNTYFTEDWIYANFYDAPETYVSDLIVGLAEESFQQGYKAGWHDGYTEGYNEGYIDGYIDGYEDGVLSTQ